MKKLSVLLALFWLLSVIPAAANVIVGLPADSGHGNVNLLTPYQPYPVDYGQYEQLYMASQFSGPITITNLEFFNTQLNFGATSTPTGNWQIVLGTTQANYTDLSSEYGGNLGPDQTLVFDGNLYQPWSFGDTLSIPLSQPFTYDPAKGNLDMYVLATDVTYTTQIAFDVNGAITPNDYMSTLQYELDLGEGEIFYGYGLVTEFSTAPTPTPLPPSALLFGTGLLCLAGACLRQRRRC